jgi:Arc/MetJ-type ribon-helix-helix transcriptional regulator
MSTGADSSISVRLSRETKRRLVQVAQRIGCGTNLSDCVRLALRDWLNKRERIEGRKK